ncbi:hypothetical protein PV772_15805 [Pseudarthrobacter sp. CC12]|uniref:hypothetical protein n=1 Tax=Pseudarthrobacter sp. CC12 TaxID=3029193 RepID=UPI003264E3B1
MCGEPSFLFEINAPVPSPNVLAPLLIKPEQMQEIRDAFEEAGVVSQSDRKALIESVIMGEVESLRELKSVDARRILQRIKGLHSRKPTSTGSAWDNREDDTWIDKL